MHCALNQFLRHSLPQLSAGILLASALQQSLHSESVTRIPAELRSARELPAFYTKMIDADGILILSSDKSEDAALVEAKYLIVNVLRSAPKLREALVDSGLRVTVMAADEYTSDVPEYQDLKPKDYWDRRARGLGGTPEIPVTSCGEENLLHYPGDPYEGENILLHEFSHSVHLVGMAKLDPDFDTRLSHVYESAKKSGLWEGTYAMENREEYFAEGAQSWFNCNAPPGKVHGEVRTREVLRDYDPELAKLIIEAFGKNSWRYTAPGLRWGQGNHKELTWPADKRFAWPDSIKDVDLGRISKANSVRRSSSTQGSVE